CLCLFVIFILFLSTFYGPKASVRIPLSLPLFSWLSGHSRAPRDTEGHKESASLLDVYDFLRKFESFQIVCEASALPLSQAGRKSFRINSLRRNVDQANRGPK